MRLTISEAAEETGLSEEVLRGLARSGAIVAEKQAGIWLVDSDDLEDFLADVDDDDADSSDDDAEEDASDDEGEDEIDSD